MRKLSEYRQHADECRKMATSSPNPEHKSNYRSWQRHGKGSRRNARGKLKNSQTPPTEAAYSLLGE